MSKLYQPTTMELAAFLDNTDVRHALKNDPCALAFEGLVTAEHVRNGALIHSQTGKNTFTTQGMARLLNIVLHETSKAASKIWYVGTFKNNITPALGDTAAKLGAGNAFGECQDADYSNPLTNRPLYNTEATTTAVISNVNAKG